MIIIARETSLQEFGAFATVYALAMAFSVLLDFGSSQLVTRELAKGCGATQFRPWLLRRTLLQAPLAILFTAAMTVLFDDALPIICILGLCLQSLSATMSQGATAPVRGLVSPPLAAWLVAAGNLVFLLSAVFAPSNLILTVTGLSAGLSWIATFALALRVARKHIGARSLSPSRNPWLGSWGFGLQSLAVSSQNFDLAIVSAISGTAEAAKLGAVNKWTTPLILIVVSYSKLLFPRLARATSDVKAANLLRSAYPVVLLGLACAIAIFFMAPFIVTNLLGARYADSSILLRLIAVAAAPVLVAQPLATLLQARGDERAVAATTCLTVLVTLAFIAVGAGHFGAVAAPIAALVGYFVNASVMAIRARRLVATR